MRGGGPAGSDRSSRRPARSPYRQPIRRRGVVQLHLRRRGLRGQRPVAVRRPWGQVRRLAARPSDLCPPHAVAGDGEAPFDLSERRPCPFRPGDRDFRPGREPVARRSPPPRAPHGPCPARLADLRRRDLERRTRAGLGNDGGLAGQAPVRGGGRAVDQRSARLGAGRVQRRGRPAGHARPPGRGRRAGRGTDQAAARAAQLCAPHGPGQDHRRPDRRRPAADDLRHGLARARRGPHERHPARQRAVQRPARPLRQCQGRAEPERRQRRQRARAAGDDVGRGGGLGPGERPGERLRGGDGDRTALWRHRAQDLANLLG